MSLWQPGDIVTDLYEFRLEPNFTPGSYSLYYGFFVGDRRMTVKEGLHHENRIEGGAFPVRLARAVALWFRHARVVVARRGAVRDHKRGLRAST